MRLPADDRSKILSKTSHCCVVHYHGAQEYILSVGDETRTRWEYLPTASGYGKAAGTAGSQDLVGRNQSAESESQSRGFILDLK